MNVLIVGGSGQIGGHAAIFLHSKGHTVTIGGRRRPNAPPALAALPFLEIDYVTGTTTQEELSPFEAIIFAAGADMRQVPAGEDVDTWVFHANTVAVPAFTELARSAGVRNFVHIGSFYPHVLPELVEANSYIRSRKLASEGVAAMSSPEFSACSIDAPFVVGILPGMKIPMFEAYVKYAEGKLGLKETAPLGAINFISVRSLSEAIAGALENGPAVSGRTLLVGDENWTYATYFGKYFSAVRKMDVTIVASDEDHPMLPRTALFAGDRIVSYEPDAEVVKILGNYRRKDVQGAIEEIVAEYHTE